MFLLEESLGLSNLELYGNAVKNLQKM